MSSKNDKKMKISFDWDNTISMSYLDEDSEEPNFIHQGYNQEFIDKMINYIKEGHEVWIVTSRDRELEDHFPQERITYHLKTLGIINYFPPERIIYTNRELKAPTLLYLGIDLHHDDDLEEVIACKEAGIECIRALEIHEDSEIVAKGIISDSSGKILLLKRTDGDKKWDLPGGHVKEIELDRGYQGLIDGYEREVAEETGLLIPNEQEIYRFDNYWNQKHTQIVVFFSQFPSEEPPVDLKIQDFLENSEAVWVSKDNLPAYLNHCTETCSISINYWLKMDDEILQEAAYLASQEKKWAKMKKRLVGYGKNKHTGGGKGHTRPSFKKSKAAPPDFAVLEEEKEEKTTKKIKISKKKV
jgi:ADP-ribose pyrophosphatase YjhB (NUDIX family)